MTTSPEPTEIDSVSRGFLATPPDVLRYAATGHVRGEAGAMLCDRVPLGARVLDVGCGTGTISALIRDTRQADVTGIEPDPVRADSCREKGLLVHQGFLDREFIDTNDPFDVVVLADVLEHVEDSLNLLELATRCLAPGGVVLASVPNVAHWSVRFALLRGRFDYTAAGIMDATHVRWFTTVTVRRLFGAAGLVIGDHAFTSGSWMSWLYRIRGFGRVPESIRGRYFQMLVQVRPEFFGCQHIVVARLMAGSSEPPE